MVNKSIGDGLDCTNIGNDFWKNKLNIADNQLASGGDGGGNDNIVNGGSSNRNKRNFVVGSALAEIFSNGGRLGRNR